MAYLGEEIKKLGFGLMRLPMAGEEIDIDQVKQMVDYFLEKGFTYFDTAYGYHNGKSEEVAKTALIDRYPREKFQFATKLPAWFGPQTTEEAQNMFWTSLKRTGAGYFDYYLLHNLGGPRTESFERFGIWDFLLKQKQAGLIKHLGFSMHDKADFLDQVLTNHPEMEFVQLQINYADWNSPVIESGKCYEVARKHNKPVIIMEPVKGGALANLPPQAAALLHQANPNVSPASWALRFAASLEGVITVLSGMSNMEQMRENVQLIENFQPLQDSEKAVIAKVQDALASIPQVPCTDCQYCMKNCPENIAIPGTFRAMNFSVVYNDLSRAKMTYTWETMSYAKASACIACGQCVEACPQSIAIIDELSKAAALLEN